MFTGVQGKCSREGLRLVVEAGQVSVCLECSPADVMGEGQAEVPLGCALLSIFWP